MRVVWSERRRRRWPPGPGVPDVLFPPAAWLRRQERSSAPAVGAMPRPTAALPLCWHPSRWARSAAVARGLGQPSRDALALSVPGPCGKPCMPSSTTTLGLAGPWGAHGAYLKGRTAGDVVVRCPCSGGGSGSGLQPVGAAARELGAGRLPGERGWPRRDTPPQPQVWSRAPPQRGGRLSPRRPAGGGTARPPCGRRDDHGRTLDACAQACDKGRGLRLALTFARD